MVSVTGLASTVFCSVFFFLCKDGTDLDRKLQDDVRMTVEALIKKVESLQNKRNVPYIPPVFWEKRKGMWESDVKFYFHGHEDMYLMREAFAVYDNNMFATAWITSCLLEAYRYGNTSKPSEDTIREAVASIKEYHNKNVPYANSLMTFWPQVHNDSDNMWISYPKNIHHLFDMVKYIDFSLIEKLLEDLGLGDIAEIMKQLLSIEDMFLQAFRIPPDFDDSFVNIGLGSLLSELRADFPESHSQWQSQNTNVTSVFDALKKYAYRPMSSDLAVNTIDTRTYFYARFFLEDAKAKEEDIALVPTWVQNIDEARTIGPKGVDMPFNINNVDVTVAANAIYGTTAGVLNGIVDIRILDDPDIQQIYLNTSNLIASMIKTNFSSRHDLALLYYPSEIEFYWFVARTYGELQRKAHKGPLPHPILVTVKQTLDEALHKYMTTAVLKEMKIDDDGNAYVDDFLGDGDLDSENRTVVRGQDRLFTTGMAVNALLSTWTVFDDQTRRLIWQKDAPDDVKNLVTKAAGFLKTHIFGLKYQSWNAFFSGSVKAKTTFPSYPANRINKEGMYLHGMEGVISEEEYQAMLKKDHAPIDFHGYNSYPDYWPFWCSEPYTYVTTMLALAKFSNTYEPN